MIEVNARVEPSLWARTAPGSESESNLNGTRTFVQARVTSHFTANSDCNMISGAVLILSIFLL